MGEQTESKDKTVFRASGLRINGTRITWPVVLFVFAVVGNAAVMQYRVNQMQKDIAEISDRPNNNRAVAVLETKVDNIEHELENHLRWKTICDGGTESENK